MHSSRIDRADALVREAFPAALEASQPRFAATAYRMRALVHQDPTDFGAALGEHRSWGAIPDNLYQVAATAPRIASATLALRGLAHPPPARLLPQLRARAGAAPAGAALRRARRPGRPLAPRQARDAARRARRRAARLQRRPRGRARRPRARRHLLGPPHATTTRDLLSLLVANSVTGAASLFRAELLDDALPFPPAQFAHFHDHWIALVALSLGDIAFVERPLYDYVQHGDATLGHAAANRMPAMRERLARCAATRASGSGCGGCTTTSTPAGCCSSPPCCGCAAGSGCRRPSAASSSASSAPTARSPRSPGSRRRGAQELLGRRRDTLGAEWMLFHAFAWRRAAGGERPRPADALRCGSTRCRRRPSTRGPGRARPAEPAARAIAEKIAPLRLAVARRRAAADQPADPVDRPPALLRGLHRQVQPRRRLAARGERVRIVTVDPVGPLPRTWRSDVEAYSGLDGLLDEVEVEFGRESQGLEVSRADALRSRRRGGPRTSRTRRCARSTPSASST